MATLAHPPLPPGLPAKVQSIPPNRTLYVKNLPDKLKKDDLKRNLYMLFATYGVILDVVALKTSKMRGQAHIVFRDADSSTQAMRALDGFTFCGKDLQIAYAKTKSDTIAKLDGTYKLPLPDLPEREAIEDAPAEQSGAAAAVFGSAPMKAVPINEQERAKGTKRAREEEEEKEEESEDEDDEMQMSESDEE